MSGVGTNACRIFVLVPNVYAAGNWRAVLLGTQRQVILDLEIHQPTLQKGKPFVDGNQVKLDTLACWIWNPMRHSQTFSWVGVLTALEIVGVILQFCKIN